MKLQTLLISSLLCVVTCTAAQAETYRWIDKNGKVVISDTPPSGVTQGVRRVLSPDQPSAETGDLSFAMRKALENYPVTLYTSVACGLPCEQAVEHLRKRNVPFSEKRIKTVEELTSFKKLHGESFPFMKVGNQTQTGFEAAIYDQLLDLAGYPKRDATAKPAAPQAPPAPPPGQSSPQSQAQPPGQAPAPPPASSPDSAPPSPARPREGK